MQIQPIGFIGAGNMTRSIIGGLVASGYSPELIVASNPSMEKLLALQDEFGIHITTDNDAVLAFADIVVMAVKPQIMADVLAALDSELIGDDKVFLSIAAGINVSRLMEMQPAATRWVRAMPNTPSAIGKGMTGLFAGANVSEDERENCGELLKAVGEIIWVGEEAKIDAVIAAAGSSPAYFFLFLEAMQAEAQNMGFNQRQARELVQQAMLGAAHMVIENPDLELSQLRQNVTSKGGTTAQAVDTFQQGGLSSLVSNAMQAAVTRAKQMSEQF